MLPQALAVMAAWGFEYRSHAVWAKDRVGTGYWFRNQHELLLIGVRGAIPAPAPVADPIPDSGASRRAFGQARGVPRTVRALFSDPAEDRAQPARPGAARLAGVGE
jgi:hypothetical protein